MAQFNVNASKRVRKQELLSFRPVRGRDRHTSSLRQFSSFVLNFMFASEYAVNVPPHPNLLKSSNGTKAV